jgi:hypothetical protein
LRLAQERCGRVTSCSANGSVGLCPASPACPSPWWWRPSSSPGRPRHGRIRPRFAADAGHGARRRTPVRCGALGTGDACSAPSTSPAVQRDAEPPAGGRARWSGSWCWARRSQHDQVAGIAMVCLASAATALSTRQGLTRTCLTTQGNRYAARPRRWA